MTNILTQTPEELLGMLQGGHECPTCKQYITQPWPECPTCLGSGAIPLTKPELNALAAQRCEGWEYDDSQGIEVWIPPDSHDGAIDESTKTKINIVSAQLYPPPYTTDWRDAGRLMVKYRIDVAWLNKEGGIVLDGLSWTNKPTPFKRDDLPHAITIAALTAALREAVEAST